METKYLFGGEYGWWILCLFLAITLILGLWFTCNLLAREKYNQTFCAEFLENLVRFGSSGGHDAESYRWMTRNSHKMQNILGDFGVYRHFQPPFKNYMLTNYPIILNGISELNNKKGIASLAIQYYQMIEDCILRYMGVLDENIVLLRRHIKNPIFWLREGIHQISFLPIRLLIFIGLMAESIGNRIYKSRIFSVVSALVWILGLLSSVITIWPYWGDAVALTKSFFAK